MFKAIIFNPKTDEVKKTMPILDWYHSAKNRDKLVGYLWEKKYRLKCTCNEPNAVMYPKLSNGKYQLVNDAVYGKHHYECDLYTEVSGERNFNNGIPVIPSEPPLSFTPVKKGRLTSEPKKTNQPQSHNKGKKTKVKKDDSIHGLLAWSLVQAKLDVLTFDKKNDLMSLYRTDVFKVKVCSKKNKPKEIISVGDLTFFDPEKDNLDWRKRVELKAPQFPDNIPPQAFTVYVVDKAVYDRESEVFTITNNGQETKYYRSVVSHHYEITKGPRLVYIVNGYVDENWETVQIYSHPVVSKDIPVLIDSNLERKFVEKIFSFKDSEIQVKKYYIAEIVNGVPLLPDFKLTNLGVGNYWSEIVEVMGMVSCPKYSERKLAIIPDIREYFQLPVKEVRPDNFSNEVKQVFNSVKSGSTNINGQ